MKKTGINSTERHIKLRLHRDTLRQLTSLNLKEVVGGTNETDDFIATLRTHLTATLAKTTPCRMSASLAPATGARKAAALRPMP
jgi:hypothetical protein